MCLQPGLLSDGTEIACRKCWQCQERKIDDWVGRCIAENKTAVAAHSITLTYGKDEFGNEDHFRAAWLTYSDVQKFFKRLRKAKYKFRYIVCGEYGSQKGRAHWHLIIFWLNRVPEHKLSSKWVHNRFENHYWPHGYQHWEKAHAKNIRYVCKYIQKDQGKDEKQGHLSMSKKPPIGYDYFNNLAQKYVDAGLAPQDLKYRFPDVRREDGSPKEFHMTETTARNFLERYKTLWKLQKGGHHPNSTLIDEHDEKYEGGYRFAPKDTWWHQKLKPVYGGSGPYAGKDPETGKMGIYSDTEFYRFWYREDGDEYSWQREVKAEGGDLNHTHPALLQAIERDRAKRGQNGR